MSSHPKEVGTGKRGGEHFLVVQNKMTIPRLESLATLQLARDVSMLPDHILQEVGIATEASLRFMIFQNEVRPALNRLRRNLDRRFGSAYWSSCEELLPDLGVPTIPGEEPFGSAWLGKTMGILTEHLGETHDATMRTLTTEIVQNQWHARNAGRKSSMETDTDDDGDGDGDDDGDCFLDDGDRDDDGDDCFLDEAVMEEEEDEDGNEKEIFGYG